MGIVLPAYAVGFNALLWLSRVGLGPAVAARAGIGVAWTVAAIAPLALLAIAARMRLAAPAALLFVSTLSLAGASFYGG